MHVFKVLPTVHYTVVAIVVHPAPKRAAPCQLLLSQPKPVAGHCPEGTIPARPGQA